MKIQWKLSKIIQSNFETSPAYKKTRFKNFSFFKIQKKQKKKLRNQCTQLEPCFKVLVFKVLKHNPDGELVLNLGNRFPKNLNKNLRTLGLAQTV